MKRICNIHALGCVVLLGLSFSWWGCEKMTKVTDASSASTEQAETQEAPAALAKGGARMWGDNCMRCHNLRPPREHSDREWALIVHHMRVRANLTAEEHRQILAFLQSAN